MKFLVVGAGSIGTRHLKNLLTLGVRNVEVCEPASSSRRKLAGWFQGAVHARLSAALKSTPEVALITTPTHLHTPAALECAKAGCHLFIEKPLSHEMKDLDRLDRLVNLKRLVCLVGCNMRFHPGLALMKKFLHERRLGEIWGVQMQFGHYLPSWRPGRNYRRTYSARADQGGGVILDCIHELDYARWFFGHVVSAVAYAPKKSVLGIKVEENVNIVLNTRHHAWIEIHLDYLQKAYKRQCRVFGSLGSLEWDWNAPGLKWFDASVGNWKHLGTEVRFETNDMYMAEMRHFLRCLCKKEEPIQNLKRAGEVLCLALALKKSLKTMKMAPVRYGRWF